MDAYVHTDNKYENKLHLVNLVCWRCLLLFKNVFLELTEKSESRFASRSEAQYSSKKDSRRENEKANAEGGILAETRRGRTLEDGNEVAFLTFNFMAFSGSALRTKKKAYSVYNFHIQIYLMYFQCSLRSKSKKINIRMLSILYLVWLLPWYEGFCGGSHFQFQQRYVISRPKFKPRVGVRCQPRP